MTLAFDALRRNKLRSLLTTLGIVIGVSAVVTMQAMGKGATAYVSESISGLGSNMLIIIPGASHGMSMMVGVPLFTPGDMDAIRREARAVGHLAALRPSMLRAVAGSNNRVTSVLGVTQLPITYVVLNNSAHGMCVVRERLLLHQNAGYNVFRRSHVAAGLASMFPGLCARDCANGAELEAALREADAAPGPSVIGVELDEIEVPPFVAFQQLDPAAKTVSRGADS